MKTKDNRPSVEKRLELGVLLPSFSNKSAPAPTDDVAPVTTVALPRSVASESLPSPTPNEGTSPVGRQLIQISVHLIDPNPLAPREIYTPEMISARAEDLRDQGQHDPIHVIPNPGSPGRYIICDGWTRVQACTTHKVLESLLAQVHDLTLTESAWFGYEQNEGRSQHTDFDRATFYEKLIAEGLSPKDLVQRAKIPFSTLSMYRAYAKLPDEILQLVRENPTKFGSRVAYALQRFYDTVGLRRSLALATKFAAEDQPVRWLLNQVQAATGSQPRKVRESMKHLRFANGFYKQRAEEIELKLALPKDKLEAFSQALEALISTVAISEPSVDAADPSEAADELPVDESDV